MSGFFNKDYLNFPGFPSFPRFQNQTFASNQIENNPFSSHMSGIGLDKTPNFFSAFSNQKTINNYVSPQINNTRLTFERQPFLWNQLITPTASRNQIGVSNYIPNKIQNIGLGMQAYPRVETRTSFPQQIGLKLLPPPNPTEATVLGIPPSTSNQTENLYREKLCQQLARIITCKIEEATFALRMLPDDDPRDKVLAVAPLSYHQIPDNEGTPPQIKQRIPTRLVGRLPLVFNIPREFLIQYAMDEEPYTRGALQAPSHLQKLSWFPFYKRIDGWDIECRKRRLNYRFDMFYKHKESKVQFRSIKEVINFILYNAYPNNPHMVAGRKRKSTELVEYAS